MEHSAADVDNHFRIVYRFVFGGARQAEKSIDC